MSRAVEQWVWAQRDLNPQDTLILLAIADNADTQTGEAWPRVEWIAQHARCSVRTVQYRLRRLVAAGYLNIQVRAGGGPNWQGERRYRPNLYTVLWPERCKIDTPERCKISTLRGARSGVSEVQPVAPQDSKTDSNTDRARTASPTGRRAKLRSVPCYAVDPLTNELIEVDG